MFARIHRQMQEREEGFTLIELLVVIIIIGILAAIAIPVFLAQRTKGYDAGVKSDLRNVATAEESYLTSNPNSYANSSELSTAGSSGVALVTSLSANDSIAVFVTGTSGSALDSTGYCLVGTNSQSKNFFYYDSLTGGLSNTPIPSMTALPTTAPSVCTGATNFQPAGTLTMSGGTLVG